MQIKRIVKSTGWIMNYLLNRGSWSEQGMCAWLKLQELKNIYLKTLRDKENELSIKYFSE